MTLDPRDFDYIATLVRERAAITLRAEKAYLVEHRMNPLARDLSLDIPGLVQRLRREPFGALHRSVIEAMTTNETSWYRDSRPFEALRNSVLPTIVADRAKERALTIWSAACSSGQEPYSVALMLKEHFPQLANWNIRIIATDLSSKMLGQAAAGRYNQLEVNRGLPASVLVKHFRRSGRDFELAPEIRQMVEFRTINLADRSWPFIPQCDIIFMRNVLIYFEDAVKRRILTQSATLLRPGGWLVLGGAETTLGLTDAYERVNLGGATMYQRSAAGVKPAGTTAAFAGARGGAPTPKPSPVTGVAGRTVRTSGPVAGTPHRPGAPSPSPLRAAPGRR